MFYVVERSAAVKRQELLDNAQKARAYRHLGNQRRFVVREPVGRFLVRIGDRLVGDAQPETQINSSPELAI